MLEKQIEQKLIKGVKNLGGMCLKFVSPGTAGVPDRIVLTKTGRVIFVELKTDTGSLTKLQKYVIGRMKSRNADVRVLKGLDEVKNFLSELERSDGI
ncbi:VRR-NUC domain-containing protein [Anaerovibrio sp.]|uniref:VRR-NUC domain-containing protein n=1 Tax=Anaerovibrio sp. TaxID=1872532 RepID=UPI003F18D5FE